MQVANACRDAQHDYAVQPTLIQDAPNTYVPEQIRSGKQCKPNTRVRCNCSRENTRRLVSNPPHSRSTKHKLNFLARQRSSTPRVACAKWRLCHNARLGRITVEQCLTGLLASFPSSWNVGRWNTRCQVGKLPIDIEIEPFPAMITVVKTPTLHYRNRISGPSRISSLTTSWSTIYSTSPSRVSWPVAQQVKFSQFSIIRSQNVPWSPCRANIHVILQGRTIFYSIPFK